VRPLALAKAAFFNRRIGRQRSRDRSSDLEVYGTLPLHCWSRGRSTSEAAAARQSHDSTCQQLGAPGL